MATINKPEVTLGGIPLAATSGITWKLTAGVNPYQTTMCVHRKVWDSRLSKLVGKPLELRIKDGRGTETVIKELYVLHEAPSDSPHRAYFIVSDKRWKWGYKLVVRDYNMARKTGDRTAVQKVPPETLVVVDKFDFLTYSLKPNGQRWTPRDAVEDVLRVLEPTAQGWRVDSWPIKDSTGRGDAGEFSLQGVQLRDQGDVALARLLSYIPGAEVYIDPAGQAVVFDAADLDATEQHLRSLPVSTWEGEWAAWVDRRQIRPSQVVVHYAREVEVLFRFEDDYRGTTSVPPDRADAYLENVLPTVDVSTVIYEYDPESNTSFAKQVPPGTWVRVDNWLRSMDQIKPAGSLPWTFDTIKKHWLKGDLDGVLGGKGLDLDPTGNVALRIQALKAHFRQTFRVNRRYMERIRDLLPVRVALLDPITGERGPASVWGEACVVPSHKAYMIERGGDPSKFKVFRNIMGLAENDAGKAIIECTPSPASVSMVDAQTGVFRIEWKASPYGLTESYVPCHLAEEFRPEVPAVITRDLAQQDTSAVGVGIKVEGGTNGIFLAPRMRYAVLLTLIPNAPNNERQFHRVTLDASKVANVFAKEFRITQGAGPTLELFVPPGELTARFAYKTEADATRTVKDLLGLLANDAPGIEGNTLAGFELCNEESHLSSHATAMAAEMLATFADNVQGTIATRVPGGGLKLVGNMAGTTIRVGSAPSGRVDVVHSFPGQQRPISRMAVLPEPARRIILGTFPFD